MYFAFLQQCWQVTHGEVYQQLNSLVNMYNTWIDKHYTTVALMVHGPEKCLF